ncbi:hypothetical protein HNR19_001757 [Nocardioides thalensis]|uniref:Uncharacterized protein n=1 Tax=Nocardioides thalensis TaxID=1914755 RepID=A0A853C105_9ACTN|nr:hypothetical protein [Nocardioides thalensis]NYJ01059.1 hypothetical protein [Nocardioides thalensis]
MTAPGCLTEPVPRALEKVLRLAVLEHATTEPRRCFPPVLHVGLPERPSRHFEAGPDDVLDDALRVEVVEAMVRGPLERSFVPLVWLTRPDAEEADCDTAWLRAVRAAGAELGVALGLVVVTRHGWHDPVTGMRRRWQRIRRRS